MFSDLLSEEPDREDLRAYRRDRRYRRANTSLLLVSLVAVAGQLLAATFPSRPLRVVDRLHETLIETMKEKDYSTRYQRLEPTIRSSLNLPLISRVILGRYWAQLEEEQRREFVEWFGRFSVAAYAARFQGYSGERFRRVGTKTLREGQVLVRTLLIPAEGDPVSLDYLLREEEEGDWRIVSVNVEGVNDLALRRAEYGTLMRDRGFDGLMAELRAHIEAMERGESGEN